MSTSDEQQRRLSTSIRTLGNLLGETIIEQEGVDLFDLEEEVRRLAKGWRTGDGASLEEIDALISELVEDMPRTFAVLKAFITYFQLVNLAEEEQRVHVLRERERAAYERGVPMRETIADALARLRAEGLTAADLRVVLADLFISPVLTAHPTETKRLTMLEKLRELAVVLEQIGEGALSPREDAAGATSAARVYCPALAERRDARSPADRSRRSAQRPLLFRSDPLQTRAEYLR